MMNTPSTRRRLVVLMAAAIIMILVFFGYTHIDDHSLRSFVPDRDTAAPAFVEPKFVASEDDIAQRLLAAPAVQGMGDSTLKYENYKWHTEAQLRALTACTIRGDCHPNAHKIFIFASVWCKMSFYMKYMGGEGVWCNGLQDSLVRQGYTVLHAGSGDWPYIAHLHRQLGDMIKVIVGETDRTEHGNLTDFYGKGFPAWKFFQFDYTPHGTPLTVGNAWTVTAEPEINRPDEKGFRNYTYLGYALESKEDTKVIPFNDRPMRVFILAKRIQYFYKSWAPACFPREMITKALKELRKDFPLLEFVGSFADDRTAKEKEELGVMEIPEGVKHIGKLNATAFDDEISQARLLLGIGWPTTSPSPYRALARGVPFLNPYGLGERGKKDDPMSWHFSQHKTLRRAEEPYVYSVERDNYDDFVAAIRRAITTPIEPLRLERMEREALDERVANFIESDWKAEAAKILEARKRGEDTQLRPNVGLFDL